LPRLAGALGMNPEMVRSIYQREEAVRLQRQGLSFAEIGQKLGVSEAEARMTFARGHVQKYGSNLAVQYGRKSGTPFPAACSSSQPITATPTATAPRSTAF
jgi:hypothetical protein